VQTFTAPLATNYKIECWGAQGGNSPHDSNNKYFNVVYGGKGGYCSGMIFLPNSFILYLYVGQSDVYQAPIFERSFNGGGGPGKWDYPRTGGGATDARLVEGNTWNDRYWGVCRGVGQNKLGHLLMKLREEYKEYHV
jgi:hypothetical protein